MKLKKRTLLELRQIMKEEHGRELSDKELKTFAYSLVGYFDLLLKVNHRHGFGNHPDGLIAKMNNNDNNKSDYKG